MHKRIIGHRGAAALAPENTLAGIRTAQEIGVKWVEFDVTLLGDGTPVLSHDEHLDRCTNLSGPLSYLNALDLAKLDAGSWFDPLWHNEPMPHLMDALLLCEELDLGVNLEIKPYASEPEQIATILHQVISAYWQQPEKLLLSCYEHDVLAAYRALDQQAALGLLFDHLPAHWLLKAQALQATSIHCDWQLISQQDIQTIKSAGFQLYCYTCNDATSTKHLFAQGVDGIFTDDPRLFSHFLTAPCYP